jgi:AcrR family transcriptional regulator
MIDTKKKILDTAERLIGEQGYGATSLRQVIAEAEVNVAAVHYHFGAKEDLLDAIVAREAGPLNQKRLAWLDRVEAEAGTGPPPVEGVLESFLMPMVEIGETHPEFPRLMGRMLTEGMMPRIVEKHFQDTAARFIKALGRALPHLGRDELMWRIHFMIGAMAHTMIGPVIMPMGGGESDYHTRMQRLVRFLGAGFRAPAESKS